MLGESEKPIWSHVRKSSQPTRDIEEKLNEYLWSSQATLRKLWILGPSINFKLSGESPHRLRYQLANQQNETRHWCCNCHVPPDQPCWHSVLREVVGDMDPTTCAALPVFHAFTGCDTVSAFGGRGKKIAGKCFQMLRRHLKASSWKRQWCQYLSGMWCCSTTALVT